MLTLRTGTLCKFSRKQFESVRKVIRRSGVPQKIQAKLDSTHLGGRPANLSIELLFCFTVMTMIGKKTAFVAEVYRTMTENLSPDLQIELGITNQKGKILISCDTLYRLFARIKKVYNWSDVSDLELARVMQKEFRQLCHDLITASNPKNIPKTSTYVSDGTAFESCSRRPRRSGKVYDKDARVGYRTKTEGNNLTDYFFGFECLVTVPVWDGQPMPSLVADAWLVPGNETGIDETVDLAQLFGNDGAKFRTLIVDRAYSQVGMENFATPMRLNEVDLVIDLKATDMGVKIDKISGAKIIAGWPHCPMTPEYLHDIRRPNYFTFEKVKPSQNERDRKITEAHNAEINKFQDLIAERRKYAFERNSRTSAGNWSWECPGKLGKVDCPNCPFFNVAGKDPNVPIVENPPMGDDMPKGCAQSTIVIGFDVLGKMAQKYYWGSPEWLRLWYLRTTVERANAMYKNSSKMGIKREWSLLVGLVKMNLLIALATVALNLDSVRKWLVNHGVNYDAEITGEELSPETIPEKLVKRLRC